MTKNKEIECHNIAAKYILNNNYNIIEKNVFENKYVNNLYIKLLKESKKLYNLIEKNGDIADITRALDNKRSITKSFKSITGFDWRL